MAEALSSYGPLRPFTASPGEQDLSRDPLTSTLVFFLSLPPQQEEGGVFYHWLWRSMGSLALTHVAIFQMF